MKENDLVAKKLEEIKSLMILILVRSGATSEEIAQALKLHPGYVRKMYPMGKVKRSKS